MSAKHTPGPWRSEPCYRSGYTVWGGTDAVPVCVVDTQDDEGRFGTIKNEADARLIAAAPDLLSFAKLVLRGLESGVVRAKPVIDVDPDAEQVDMRPLATIARAAIAKAEGA